MNTQPEPEHWATCVWCPRTVPLGEAIDEGWTPEWWHGEVSHSAPACTSCAAKHLEEDADGEMVLKPGHPLPEGER
jgi:hypothetical protein